MARDQLAAHRKARGFTQEALAQALQVTTSTVAHWEQGTSTPRARHRRPLADVLDVSLTELDRLLDVDGHRELNGHAVPAWLGHLASLEQAAAELRAYEPTVIHGLLQTVDYATAVESVGSFSAEQVAEKVRVRLARQAVLTRRPEPLRLSVVLDASVLMRAAGPGPVMAGQFEHLLNMAEMPTVSLQVMPLSSAVFPAAFGAFALLTSPGADDPYMAVIEDAAGPHYLDRPYDIDRHSDLFGHLSAAALSPFESVDLIRRTAKETYR
jgi:transcriptional regulator with XRE-family HTH domain